MPVVTVFAASFTGAPEVARAVTDSLGYRAVGDSGLLARAAEAAGVSARRIEKALSGPPGLSLNPGLARARLVAHLRLAVAEALAGDDVLCEGAAGLLVPSRVSHVLRVCLVATPEARAANAVAGGLSERDAAERIRRDDQAAAEWSRYVTGRTPWDRRSFDLRLPMQDLTVREAAAMVAEHAVRRTLAPTRFSRATYEDFRVAAAAAVRLTEAGHDVDVECEDGAVTVLVNRSVLSLPRYAEKLAAVVEGLSGVRSVAAKAGPRYPATGTFYREEDFQLPARVLLVDDESEFVMALSERLRMRDIGASVALSGEEALSLVDTDPPEVVVLDLRMPGVDGIEVLRRLKRDHPEVEVVILTGHGTEEDEKLAKDLGAFAYLQKPVDIEQLTRTMEAAQEKIRRRRAETEGDAKEAE